MNDSEELAERISEIYDAYYLDVYRFLVCFLGDRSDAEDLSHETFLQVLKSIDQFNGKTKIKTWIISIAKHKAIDFLRRKKFQTVFKDAFFREIRSASHSPETILNEKEINRLVIILRGINECPTIDTAEILDWSQSKVKKRDSCDSSAR